VSERSDTALVVLVLLAIVAVLFAPIVGRSGWPTLATALMAMAAGAGVASFGLALRATLRAGRRLPRAGAGGEEP
jgi:O-antigen/teichoic acid export membrane protein